MHSSKFVPDEKQQEAIRACTDSSRRICAITGKAGTGKTTIIRVVAETLEAAGYSYALGAPTGKAAKRIQEATGLPATTFHRMLEFSKPGDPDPKTGRPIWHSYPRRGREDPLAVDVVIGDEYAMTHKALHGDIVGALRPGARLLVFGDVNQLAPIEDNAADAKTPSKFTELLAKFKGIILDTIHRTGEGSGIADNGGRVLRGFAPLRRDDFSINYTNSPVQVLLSYIREIKPDWSNFQVICPQNVGWCGTYKLNLAIQSTMGHSGARYNLPRHEWAEAMPVHIRVGDKVVMNKNHYAVSCNDGTMGVFNGETGTILDISNAEIEIDWGDRVSVVPASVHAAVGDNYITDYPQRDLALGYALTTHKCQGSEYAHVVYLMNKSQMRMLNRQNLYTGITRARNHVHLISDTESLGRACTTLDTVV